MSQFSIVNEISKPLRQGKWVLCLGILIIIITPYIFTRPAIIKDLSFQGTGEIGDTIGGITAPFVNLIGAILVFLALKAQIQANKLVQSQIERDSRIKDNEAESTNLNLLYSYLNDSINNFKFTTLPVHTIMQPPYDDPQQSLNVNIEKECTGGDAFYKMFDQILCHYHYSEDSLALEQSASELYSILTVMDSFIDQLNSSVSNNSKILFTLVKHQFYYKITTRIRSIDDPFLKKAPCSSCQKEHGIPDELLEIIVNIRTKLKSQEDQ